MFILNIKYKFIFFFKKKTFKYLIIYYYSFNLIFTNYNNYNKCSKSRKLSNH